MRPAPLRARIPAALALAPMTVDALARCLAVSRDAVRDAIALLRRAGVVARAGRCGDNGRPWDVWQVIA